MPPAPYIESMAELHARLRDQVEIGEALDGLQIGGQEIDFFDRRRLRRSAAPACRDSDSISAMIDGLPEPPYQALYFTPFHCAGLCDEVIMMPPAAPRPRTPKLSAGVGVMSLASMHRNAGCRDDLGACARKRFRAEARVVADAEALWQDLLSRAHKRRWLRRRCGHWQK